jgi:hypothetical protein
VDLGQREVPVREDEPVAEVAAYLLDDGYRGTAVRAFEVAVLDEGELGPQHAADVVEGSDRGIQA